MSGHAGSVDRRASSVGDAAGRSQAPVDLADGDGTQLRNWVRRAGDRRRRRPAGARSAACPTSPWVVVLAAGEGERVRSLTRDRQGQPAPKQFASADGELSLLGATLQRARGVAPSERIVTIVAAHHECWWRAELEAIPPANILVQPENRGTSAGILLPLLWILRRDRRAVVVVLPSDHFVEFEGTLCGAVSDALTAVARRVSPIVLLGVTPDGSGEDYGWIVPGPGRGGGPYRVAAFFEKPDPPTAASLLRRGALWNTFIMIADGTSLVALFRRQLPQLWASFEGIAADLAVDLGDRDRLAGLYGSIRSSDFSRDVLEAAAERIWVHPVPPCGWTDLGTPRSLEDHLARRHRNLAPGGRGFQGAPAPR